MVLAFWTNVGPSRAKISNIGQGTPTFYWPPRLYLPIGIQKCPYFYWSIFFIFGSGQHLRGDLCFLRQCLHRGANGFRVSMAAFPRKLNALFLQAQSECKNFVLCMQGKLDSDQALRFWYILDWLLDWLLHKVKVMMPFFVCNNLRAEDIWFHIAPGFLDDE